MRTAFPFYPSLSEQARNLTICQGERSYALIAPSDRFLPFAFRRPLELNNVECCNVYNAITNQAILFLQPAQVGIALYKDALYEYVVYAGGAVSGLDLDCGQYYLKVDEYFSEVFRVVNDLSGYTKLEWRNEVNLGEILYQTGFTNKLYLETPITRLKPEMEEKGGTDALGNFVPEFQKLIRRFELKTLPVPQYLHDALMLLQIHDQVQIGEYVNVQRVEVEADNMSACNTLLTISFQEEQVTINKTCIDPLELETVPVGSYSAWKCDPEAPNTDPIWVDVNPIQERCGGSHIAPDGTPHPDSTNHVERWQTDNNPESETYAQFRWWFNRTSPDECPISEDEPDTTPDWQWASTTNALILADAKWLGIYFPAGVTQHPKCVEYNGETRSTSATHGLRVQMNPYAANYAWFGCGGSKDAPAFAMHPNVNGDELFAQNVTFYDGGNDAVLCPISNNEPVAVFVNNFKAEYRKFTPEGGQGEQLLYKWKFERGQNMGGIVTINWRIVDASNNQIPGTFNYQATIGVGIASAQDTYSWNNEQFSFDNLGSCFTLIDSATVANGTTTDVEYGNVKQAFGNRTSDGSFSF